MPTLDSITTPRTTAQVFEAEEFTVRGTGLDAANLLLRLGDRPLTIVRRTATEIVARAPWEPDCAPLFLEQNGTLTRGPVLAVAIRPPDTAPPIPPDPPVTNLRQLALDCIRLTNEERAKAGVRAVAAALVLEGEIGAPWESLWTPGEKRPKGASVALTENAALAKAAQLHASDMGQNDYFSHTSQDGRSPFDRMAAAGYRGAKMAENIARGFTTAQMVLSAWMNSTGHRANILNPAYREIGVGVATWTGNGYVWVQCFGGP